MMTQNDVNKNNHLKLSAAADHLTNT